MLMNLLPGLRDLRAPLASGYLWLAGLWLLFVDVVPPRGKATGVVAHVYTLTHDLGRGTVLIAISFAAYLLGAVLSVNADGYIAIALGELRLRLRLFPHLFPDYYYARWEISGEVVSNLRERIERLRQDTPAIEVDIKDPAVEEWNASLQHRTFGLAYTLAAASSPELRNEWTYRIWAGLIRYMLDNLMKEIKQLVTRLRVSSPPLYDQYDRARGEAEFRLSVAFPLTFIMGILAWKWTPLWLLLLPGIALIMESGIQRARDAVDVVAQAALTGYVTPTGWINESTQPLTIAREALDVALRSEFSSFKEGRDVEKVEKVFSVLPMSERQPLSSSNDPASSPQQDA